MYKSDVFLYQKGYEYLKCFAKEGKHIYIRYGAHLTEGKIGIFTTRNKTKILNSSYILMGKITNLEKPPTDLNDVRNS